MVQRKPTPEEQLLKLIENTDANAKAGAAPASGNAAAASVPGAKKKPAFQIGKLFGFLDYFKHALAKKPALKGKLNFKIDLKWINRGLIGLIGVVGIYLLLDLFFIKPGQADFLNQVSTTEPIYPKMENPAAGAVKDLAFYKEMSAKRNPFLPPHTGGNQPTVEEEETPAPSQSEGGSLNDRLQNYKLVGISWGEEPLAMIEDGTTGRTFFLRQGQELNGVKVQAISKEKVTVTYEGQEGELF